MSEEKYNTNLAAEFHVLSILHRLGASASLTLGTMTSLRHHSLRIVAEFLAARADRLPDWLTRRLSKEGRPGVNPVSL